MISSGMYQGNMHNVLRDAGRLAGGAFSANFLSTCELQSLLTLAQSLANDKKLAEITFNKAVEFGKSQPV